MHRGLIKPILPQEGTGPSGESLPEISGSPIVSGGGKIPDGDAVCHTSRLVSPSNRGKKRAKECLFATMNVCGGVDAKIDEICEMMDVRKIDVLGVSESKKKGCGTTTHGRYSAYWSGVAVSERGSQGVGVILSDRMNECVKGYECVSPRLLWLRLKIGLTRIFILCVYAPDMSKPKGVRDEFWDNVKDVLDRCEENERIILLGDFNGWVGVCRDGYDRVLGKFGDERVNDNGTSLLEVCLERKLVVTNTTFSHRMIHMYTWQRQSERSMIDFVIVDERLKERVKDTRVYRGVNVGSDHFLVVTRISGLLKKWRHRPRVNLTGMERVKVERLEEEAVCENYNRVLKERFDQLLEDDDREIEEFWEEFKNGVVETAIQVCGVCVKKNIKGTKNEWWDDEVRDIIERKKKAWIDLLAARANRRIHGGENGNKENMAKEMYDRLRKSVKEIVSKKKEECKNKYDRKFSENFRANAKLFWNFVRKARGKVGDSKVSMIRDSNGNIISEHEEVMKQWKVYFESLFERGEIDGAESVSEEITCETEINMEEIMKAMKSMKVGKAAGCDRISAEMLKRGGGVIASLLYLLFNKCWRSGHVPGDWGKAVIVPLYKGKGSQQECKNYRGISLLSIVGKLYAKILIERVINETESKIWDVQAGFRKGMGCTDQVFSLRCIAERTLAKHQKVFCAFIDLEKAYDSVVRNELWSTLAMYGVDGSLIRALRSLYKDSSACVRLNGVCTDWFSIERGVRQGCVASPWLFNLFMDSCLTDLKESECGLRMNETVIKTLLYADDQVLLASSASELQQMVTVMNESFRKKGLKVNVRKTKVMVMERDEDVTECQVVIGDEKVEQVNEFVYLGSLFTRDGKCDRDIERRVKAGNSVNGALHSVMTSQMVSSKARLAIVQGVLAPTLMYGSESWVWQKKHESKINAVEMRALRSMCGVRLIDRVRNSVIRERCGLKDDIVTKIEKGMLRWFGHLERMDDRRVTKELYRARMDGNVGRGRPRRTYVDQIGDVLKKGQIKSTHNRRACMNRLMNVEEAKEVCLNRSIWRSIVSAYPKGRKA